MTDPLLSIKVLNRSFEAHFESSKNPRLPLSGNDPKEVSAAGGKKFPLGIPAITTPSTARLRAVVGTVTSRAIQRGLGGRNQEVPKSFFPVTG